MTQNPDFVLIKILLLCNLFSFNILMKYSVLYSQLDSCFILFL